MKCSITTPDGEYSFLVSYSTSAYLGCHITAVTNLQIMDDRVNAVTWRRKLGLREIDAPVLHMRKHYLPQILEAICRAFAANPPASQVLFTGPINYLSQSRAEPYQQNHPLTGAVANMLIKLKLGVVTASPVMRNSNHTPTNLSLTQTWIWTPPKYTVFIIPTTGGLYGRQHVKRGLFTHIKDDKSFSQKWCTQPETLLEPHSWKMYPHYRKIKAVAHKIAEEIEKEAGV